MAMSAEQMSKRYQEGTQSSSARARYLEGVQGVTESPMAKAADAEQLYLQRVTDSVTSGRRKAALLAVPLSRWKENSVKKGAERLASGAAAALDKVRAHFQKWAPVYENIRQTVAAMPKGSTQASIDRVATAIRMSKQAAGKSD